MFIVYFDHHIHSPLPVGLPISSPSQLCVLFFIISGGSGGNDILVVSHMYMGEAIHYGMNNLSKATSTKKSESPSVAVNSQ